MEGYNTITTYSNAVKVKAPLADFSIRTDNALYLQIAEALAERLLDTRPNDILYALEALRKG